MFPPQRSGVLGTGKVSWARCQSKEKERDVWMELLDFSRMFDHILDCSENRRRLSKIGLHVGFHDR